MRIRTVRKTDAQYNSPGDANHPVNFFIINGKVLILRTKIE